MGTEFSVSVFKGSESLIPAEQFPYLEALNAATTMITKRSRLRVTLIAMLLSNVELCAQGLDALTVGARIRVVARDTVNTRFQRRFVAFYGGVQGDSLYFQIVRETPLLALPLGEIQRVDLSQSHRSGGRGALVGAGYGMLVGLSATIVLLAHASGRSCDDCWIPPVAGALITAVPFTVLTTALGAIAFSRRQDEWREVQLRSAR